MLDMRELNRLVSNAGTIYSRMLLRADGKIIVGSDPAARAFWDMRQFRGACYCIGRELKRLGIL